MTLLQISSGRASILPFFGFVFFWCVFVCVCVCVGVCVCVCVFVSEGEGVGPLGTRGTPYTGTYIVGAPRVDATEPNEMHGQCLLRSYTISRFLYSVV